MSKVDARLVRLLGGEDLTLLRQKLRRRFEMEDLEAPIRSIRLTDLTPVERSALTQLTGSPVRSSKSFTLELPTVDEALDASGVATSLRAALEMLDGPILHKPTVQAAEASRWEGVVSRCEHAAVGKWLSVRANIGLLKRLSGGAHNLADQICLGAARVLSCLPADGIPLAQLAAESIGDAHALDAGQPVATAVVSILRGELSLEGYTVPDEDDRTRSVWARAGVMVNELARPALLLNVPFAVADESKVYVRGQPDYASLRWLLRSHPRWNVEHADVFVCENPNIVAIAADQLGARCAPLVCTDGMPAAAQRVLLTQLRSAGARLKYHGDFDWPGIRIANLVLRQHGATTWRMDEKSHAVAAQRSQMLGKELSGPAVAATWASGLHAQMADHGLGIPEEAVVATLLDDLSAERQGADSVSASHPERP